MGWKTIKWKYFISRPRDFFLSMCSLYEFESEMMDREFGFGYKNIVVFSKGNVIECYVDEEHLKKGMKWLEQKIKSNPSTIITQLKDAEKWKQKMEKLMQNKNACIASITKKNVVEKYDEIIEIFYEYMLWVVSVPVFILTAYNEIGDDLKEDSDANKIKELAEYYRKESMYPQFLEEIIPELYKKIAEIKGVDAKKLQRILPVEMKEFLKTNDTPHIEQIASEREKNFGFVYMNFKRVPISMQEIEEQFKVEIAEVNMIKGMCACKGRVQGYAKVIITSSDFAKFNKGDILITINSNPSFMPVITKAAAIVSNEGGIACHAAIISRELNIPCIVGTKIATKVLKDGDMVEVDAEKGTVKKL